MECRRIEKSTILSFLLVILMQHKHFWSFTDYGSDYRAFSDGNIDGGFYRAEAQSSTEFGAALIVIYATNLERTKERVLACGGSIIKDIFSFPGGRRFHFADPNRNELAVWSELK